MGVELYIKKGMLLALLRRPSLYEFSDPLSTIDSLRSLSLNPLTSLELVVHDCPRISSSVASRIASKSES